MKKQEHDQHDGQYVTTQSTGKEIKAALAIFFVMFWVAVVGMIKTDPASTEGMIWTIVGVFCFFGFIVTKCLKWWRYS